MRRVLLSLVPLGLLAGCGGGLYDFPTVDGTTQSCRALLDDVPETVLEQGVTPVDSDRVAAWGDPRIVLRCGVTPPESLLPTSRCDDVDGIGWFTEKRDGGGSLFTTIGRDPNVSVEVPGDFEPAGAALVDLADTIKADSKAVRPCV